MIKRKNVIFSIIFVSILVLNYFIFINQKEESKAVFNDNNEEKTDYGYYYVTFTNLTTKNFNKTFDNMENKDYNILKLYTEPNSKYNDDLKNKLKEYSFDNINDFVEYYIKKLDEYKFDEDINNINVYGIKIDKVLIYINEENLKSFSKNVEKITYKKKED